MAYFNAEHDENIYDGADEDDRNVDGDAFGEAGVIRETGVLVPDVCNHFK